MKKGVVFAAVFLVLVFFLLMQSSVNATNYYVSPAGNDSNNGSIGNPWDLTYALAWAPVKPGDTIYVREGTYHPSPSYPYFMTYINGNASNLITVMPYNNEKVIIDGQIEAYGEYVMFRDFEVAHDYIHSTNNSRVMGQPGFELNCGFNVWVRGVKIVNNIIHDCPRSGMLVNCAPGSEVYGNIIYNNGYDDSDRGHGHGIYIQNANDTIFILNNIAFNNLGRFGIHAYGESTSDYHEFVNNIHLENNTVFKNTFLAGGMS